MAAGAAAAPSSPPPPSSSAQDLSNATDPFAITAADPNLFKLPLEVQVLMSLFYATLAFTAVASNIIVCYIVLSNQKMRTATNYFIVNLAVGDLLMALLCIPFTFPSNIIYQFWPFGLSLCIVVSYSQAISVFISAYSMVAISIDKYTAIMYPMRLRMPKKQAKIIILVIWTAALLTSLPTALLSSLVATPDLNAAPASPSAEPELAPAPAPAPGTPPADLGLRADSQRVRATAAQSAPSGDFLAPNGFAAPDSAPPLERHRRADQSPSTNPNGTRALHAGPQHAEDHRKYFCQETWAFWPPGKYYYSMALMILQFVLPLFVLVLTYTKIVIVVWGKRTPGEEDDARDARMARSKRKMIKMVILCVIAFALTWLPFNALIVIGDIEPRVWEHKDIMYIWFITHYLAMCHTITNPLIYIWMNNRFRAGFRQVIGDSCALLARPLLLSCRWCCPCRAAARKLASGELQRVDSSSGGRQSRMSHLSCTEASGSLASSAKSRPGLKPREALLRQHLAAAPANTRQAAPACSASRRATGGPDGARATNNQSPPEPVQSSCQPRIGRRETGERPTAIEMRRLRKPMQTIDADEVAAPEAGELVVPSQEPASDGARLKASNGETALEQRQQDRARRRHRKRRSHAVCIQMTTTSGGDPRFASVAARNDTKPMLSGARAHYFFSRDAQSGAQTATISLQTSATTLASVVDSSFRAGPVRSNGSSFRAVSLQDDDDDEQSEDSAEDTAEETVDEATRIAADHENSNHNNHFGPDDLLALVTRKRKQQQDESSQRASLFFRLSFSDTPTRPPAQAEATASGQRRSNSGDSSTGPARGVGSAG